MSAGVLAGADAAQLLPVTSPPETSAAPGGGASVNPLAHEAGVLVAGVRAPIAESGTAISVGTTTVTVSPLGAEGTRDEAAESSAPLVATPGAPSPPAVIAATAAAAAAVATGAADSVTSATAAAAAAAATAAAAAGSTAAVPAAAGTFAAGFVRPGGSPLKAQSARRAKRPRKESPAGNLAPAPNTSRLGAAFSPIPPFAQFLSPGGSGGALFPPGLSYPGFMGQWNWLAAGMASASMAAAAGSNVGGGKTPLPLPLPLPSPFSGISAQAVGALSAPGPAKGLASVKDAATAAVPAPSTPGTLGFHPGHYRSPATSIATASRTAEGAVAQAQAQVDRASGEGSVSGSAPVDNGAGSPEPSPPPPSIRADASSSASEAVAAAAPREESSSPPPHCDAPQEGSVSDGSERWAGEIDEEEAFLATLVNSMDPSSLKTVGVRRAMMSRLKNVGRTVAG